MKKIDVTLSGGTIVMPSSTNIDAGEEVKWNLIGASGWELTVSLPAILIISGGALPVSHPIPGDPHPVSRTVDHPGHTLRKLGSNPFNASCTLSLWNPKSLRGPVLTATSTLVIERGVEPVGGDEPCHRPWRRRRSNAAYPEAAGTPDPSGEEQRLER